MCCFFTILLFQGPRVANVIWWIASPGRWELAFNSVIWPILGIVFVPWTTLMYLIVCPNGVTGFDWVWLGLGLISDVGMYAGGGFSNRDRIPV